MRNLALSLAFFLTLPLVGQVREPNADIVKMIRGRLPESVVIAKIKQGAGQWDTSVDALIALKAAGATDAELKVLTDTATSKSPSIATPKPTTPQGASGDGAPVIFNGDMMIFYLRLPSIEEKALESKGLKPEDYKQELAAVLEIIRVCRIADQTCDKRYTKSPEWISNGMVIRCPDSGQTFNLSKVLRVQHPAPWIAITVNKPFGGSLDAFRLTLGFSNGGGYPRPSDMIVIATGQ